MDSEHIQELLQRYFNGCLEPLEMQELQHALRTKPEARTMFHVMAGIDSLLLQWGEISAQESHALTPEDTFSAPMVQPTLKKPVFFRGRHRFWFAASGIAAALVMFLGAHAYLEHSSRAGVLAKISYSSQVTWSEKGGLPSRGSLTAQSYYLQSGFLRLETLSGAVVSLAAPAKFELKAPDEIHLSYGKMTARLNTDAASLRVFTDSMLIRDLGTAFGLQVEENGESSVSVFEGSIEVSRNRIDAPNITLGEGLTLKGHASVEHHREQQSRYAENFNDLWPLTLGISSYSPLVRLAPPGRVTTPLWALQSSLHVHLIPERQGVILNENVFGDLPSGKTNWPAENGREPLPQGISVSSFLLQFNPEKSGEEEWIKRVSGQIRFEKEIVGIICLHDALVASDKVFAIEGLEYNRDFGDANRGLEDEDVVDFGYYVLAHDMLSISRDRRQIYFNFNATTLMDQVRIILDD